MILDQLFDAGAMPTLGRMMQFAARRQELIANNIANLSTPGFIQKDVSVTDFQHTLGKAVARRRERSGSGPLELESTREVRFAPNGSLQLTPRTNRAGILYHDRNNRDLERLMQDMVENMTVFRVAGDLLRSQMSTLSAAISENV